jgi:hypothetical protein
MSRLRDAHIEAERPDLLANNSWNFENNRTARRIPVPRPMRHM